ncbi:23S rRNA (uridine(2552)-2'-O)-methyltransferase [Candidatus Purcelliella pentastirinorum]|uniref:Ribosomal RNA large subunit methyltransferase E n=1 Tax=Candidatus Purcelliella pentastirinorum TaxID=472834 RepID=A0AAX3NA17_9ENTR|nr:SAM-dependent methyltransferase [Candidatus Purcelliella pentastirinorum]WDI78343.1 23S rRNA (uridine(2552)-2'-O)-methyltransferase [Candidatus Purcelliella pentastirinorum]
MNRWFNKHTNDFYTREAFKKKLRARSWYKLSQINKKDKLFKKNMIIIDLGSAPGGWSKYAVKKTNIKKSLIISNDILPMKPINGINFIKGDIKRKSIKNKLIKSINKKKVDLLMSDMSPNISGIPSIDIPKSINLIKLATKIAKKILKKEGKMLIKAFQSKELNDYLKYIHTLFKIVKIRKPYASKISSREIYILATNKI